MRKTDLAGIRAVIHRVRAERFPHLSETFLDMVLDVESTSVEDDAGAQRRIREAVAQLDEQV